MRTRSTPSIREGHRATGDLGVEDGNVVGQHSGRCGKAPSVDLFMGENPELHMDNWLRSGKSRTVEERELSSRSSSTSI